MTLVTSIGGWADFAAAGTHTTTLQGVDMKAGARVRLVEMPPNMALSSRTKRLSFRKNTSNRGRFGMEVETSSRQRQFRRPSDSMKPSSSEGGTTDGVTTGKDGAATETTPSDIRDRPPFRQLPAKRASAYCYIENPR